MGKNGRLWTNRAIPGGDGLNFSDAGSVDSSRRFGGLLDPASPKFKFSAENRELRRFREPRACRSVMAGGHAQVHVIRFRCLEHPESWICGGDRDGGGPERHQSSRRLSSRSQEAYRRPGCGGRHQSSNPRAAGVTKVHESRRVDAAGEPLGASPKFKPVALPCPCRPFPASPRFKSYGRDGTGPPPGCARTQPPGKESPWRKTLRRIRPWDRRESR